MPLKYLKITLVFALSLVSFFAKGQLTAAFTADFPSGCTPLVVHFSNTSVDATSYSWNLGNGSSSSLSDPSASYITPGTYTVTLTAYNGGSSSTHSMVVNVYPLPTVNFAASDTTICPGTPVVYNNYSVGGTPGAVSYVWNFGDGSTSSAETPTYGHPTPGSYNITLFATNSMGCEQSKTKVSYLEVYTPPVAGYSGTDLLICNPPGVASFSNSSSGTFPLSYNWLFGDGASSAAPNPTHSYSVPGDYDVRLLVVDGRGCRDSLINSGFVTVSSLSASMTAPSVICQYDTAAIFNTGAAYTTTNWSFGDGYTSADVDVEHQYLSFGSFNINLIVGDGICFDTAVRSITVNPAPVGSFTVAPSVACPVPVTLNYIASIPGGSSATWQFLDDGTASGPSSSRSYSYGLMDTAVLSITNGFGCTTRVEQIDTVYDLVLELEASEPLGCAPLNTSFVSAAHVKAYNPLSGEFVTLPFPYTITGYSWNFGDGSPPVSTPTPSHTYIDTGVYNVTCTITTARGCTATSTIKVGAGVPPAVSISAVSSHICAGQRVYFNASTIGTATSFKWEFGDGGIDTGDVTHSSVHHTYTIPGIDTARVVASHHGCPSLESKMPVEIDSPNAVSSLTYLCIPNNGVAFGDSSLGADSRLWIFGDGDTSSLKNPVHYFPGTYNYSAQLTTFNNASGCRDTIGVSVKLAPPLIYMIADDPTICIHEQTDITPFVLGGSAQRYKWHVDDVQIVDTTVDVFTYRYDVPGLHDITLIIKDDRNCLDTFRRDNYMLIGNPIDSFTAVPPTGCGPLPVDFIDHSTGLSVCPLKSYFWSFGDGDTVTNFTPGVSHLYLAPGTYDARLVVTDSIGCTDTTTPPVQINVYRPHAGFYADLNNVCYGEYVHFNNTSTDYVSCLWLFGDGDTSTTTNPYHLYSSSGVFTPRLVATDVNGCSDTAVLLNYIYIAPSPHAVFSMSDSFAVCPPLNVSFSNSSTGAVTFNWDFGDGSSSIATSPSNPYSASGYYPVSLVAFNSIGCTDTAVRHVNIFGYSGAFSYTPLSGCNPLFVDFSAVLGNVASLVWDFGDGTTSGVSMTDTISHTYTTSGYFVPKLILTDTTGCTNASVGLDTILVDVVNPDFTVAPNPVCQGSAFTVTDASTATFSAPESWLWNFGGGSTDTGMSATHTYTIAGTHVVTLSVTNAYGCTTTTSKTVSVNPLPANISGTMTVCEGSTTPLFNASGGGTWVSGTTSVATVSGTGVVTGIAAGTSVITYTLPTGCSIDAVVTVIPLPGAISGADEICVGATTPFSSSTTGGTWNSSASLVASVHGITGVVTGASGGMATITYTATNGCYVTKGITINTVPSPILGTLTLCKGATTTLFQSLSGGTWISGDATVATVDGGGVVSGVNAGTAIITYAFSSGCQVNTTVTVHPLPADIEGGLSICLGFTSALSDTSAGGTWFSTDVSVAPITASGVVTGLFAGTSVISYTLPTGCYTNAIVTVNPLPVAISGATIACIGSPITLTNASPGGSWSSSDTAIVTVDAFTGTYTGVAAGTADIIYTLPTGCTTNITVTIEALPPPIGGGDQVCAGFALNLTNGLPGGVWSATPSPSMIATIHPYTGVVTGITPGTVTVSYTISTGCRQTQVVTVIVLPPVISGTPRVCVGDTTALSNTLSGGTWTTANPSIAVADPTTGLVAGVSAGTTVVTYTVGSGCFTVLSITVNPLPMPVTGPDQVCVGGSITLFDATPSGVWISDHTDTATVDLFSGVITGVRAGTTGINYALATGCKRTKYITVNPIPTDILGTPHVCIGAGVTLSDTTAGGVWVSSDRSVATIDSFSGVVSSVALGTSVIRYVFPSTGCFASIVVTVHPLPNVFSVTGGGNYCSGDAGVHIGLAGSQPGVSYLLYYGSFVTGYGPGTGSAIDFGLLTATGVYTVMATDVTSGCTNDMSGSATVGILPIVLPSVSVDFSPDDTVCAGDAVALTPDTSHAGSSPSYLWHVNGSLVSSGPAYSFVPANGDVITVTMNSNADCRSVTTVFGSDTMTVLPVTVPSLAVSASPGDTVCLHTPVSYSAFPTYGGHSPQYQWMVNGLQVGVGPSYFYVPLDGDEVYCVLISDYLCRSVDTVSSGPVNMVIDSFTTPNVTITPDPGLTVGEGELVTLYTTVTNAGPTPGYQWRLNGYPISGATNSSYAAVFHDNDSVVCNVTSSGFCEGVTSFDWVFINIGDLGVMQHHTGNTDLRIVPNPNKGNFSLTGSLPVRGNVDVAITITDMLGQKVYTGRFKSFNGSVSRQIDLDNSLANGVYSLTSVWDGGREVIHFIISR